MHQKASKAPKASAAKAASPERATSGPARQPSAALNPLWQQVATTPVPPRIQAKLTIGASNDPYEREADQVADQVMRMPEPGSAIQRKCAKCEEEEGVQAKEAPGEVPALSPTAESRIQGLRGGGSPLPEPARSYFEPRFGHDFSSVRIHTGSEAAETAQSIHARAYTVGRDIVFGGGQFAPSTPEGGRLLAHELTHVVQQGGTSGRAMISPRIQRDATCPARPAGESAQSRTPAGVLAANTRFSTSGAMSNLDIMDFAVNSATLPPDVQTSTDWQRAMSLILGDPSMQVAISAYTDCVGSDAENLQLRQTRRDTVINVLPATARSRVLLSYVISTTTFLDTNTTAEGRARNRSVRVSFTPLPTQQSACDRLTRAGNLDEYLFLIRCLESRLGLGAASQVRTALSVVRQIYYGTGAWSANQNRVWGNVITNPPWAPGTNPEPQLGARLMAALRNSAVVEGVDVGHLFTGLDAMLNPQDVTVAGFQTSLVNEEWATWAGDVGSAAAEWALDVYQTGTQGNLDAFFTRFASDADLKGDVAAFAFRSGASAGTAPPQQLRQALSLTGPLSEALLQYFRLTATPLGGARGRAARTFIEAYGGVLSGNTLTNRPALVARLQPSVETFAGLFTIERIMRGVTPAPGSPPPQDFLAISMPAMTERFVDWLLRNL